MPEGSSRPVVLVILDGWGSRRDAADNAVLQAKTPVFDRLWSSSPHASLKTCGLDVGLPKGQMGNSEVGHLNIGAGRVVMQNLPRIDESIADGSIARNEALTGLIETLRKSGGTCHLLGLLSPGGVHAHQKHAIALARIVSEAGVPVKLHAFLDGRDMPPRSAAACIAQAEESLPEGVRIATVCGRYYAMDRDRRWERVGKAYRLLVSGEGKPFATAQEALAASYADNLSDEFALPAVIGGYEGMKDGDGLLCVNFRADRTRQILTALLDPDFADFDRGTPVRFAGAVGIVQFSVELDRFLATMFPPLSLKNGFGETVSAAGLKQLRMAETEKYPHVTYFFNGGIEKPWPGQDSVLIPSPKVATYDLQPEMSAPELTERAVERIGSGLFDVVIINFANPDMVGHTGDLAAAVKAVETVDTGLGAIAEAIAAQGGTLLVTADHGNCELMRDPTTGEPHTAHTLNEVPVILVGREGMGLRDGRLADVAPTLLALCGLPQPEEMTGQSLLTRP
ncbi:2,3-bisphosphoglycerate-independent phosphoglycerate mutase [Methylobacterium aerolatum]|nr:2,3-bisphosphoglycerate-independent phosphoglycerate mutase [Methylobacterium aerolatum]GJD36045.1 2,3-bisphosphoglycerate-independent phosphoglycerate mutase [Methylobacterium aerolatum]